MPGGELGCEERYAVYTRMYPRLPTERETRIMALGMEAEPLGQEPLEGGVGRGLGLR